MDSKIQFTFFTGVEEWTMDPPPKLANDSARRGGGRMQWCPVGDITGEWHRYPSGTGEMLEWDMMGDARNEVEVCASCAGVSADAR